MNEISRRDEVSLSGAALRGAPWKAAAVGGGVAAAAGFGVSLLTEGGDPVWALGLGISLFALIAAIGAVSKPEVGDRVTRQARLWSLQHPWRFSLLPAAIVAVLDYPVQLVLDGDGVFGSAWDAAWHGALVYLISAVLTLTMQGRARSSR
ncbi:hypothetical protein ACGFJC_50900 [Nonomuraea fuscirosea]|jgi:hypothetical protein|uniref:Uncharacterized protein n=1 Tax=Nonomuraea fuscirosea TaxID=1291556 RepID=A0A2T0N035_9ACTN|nr:hypothetical protein [Nonomuraea fuscirosea]PRX65012.1 hypothetical protein B0I32_108378 [Nonomuraea fuscirosea]WSA52368.1 hypothetical protein OIE67_51535 [Nonomuraea fuscirosea]